MTREELGALIWDVLALRAIRVTPDQVETILLGADAYAEHQRPIVLALEDRRAPQ